MTPWARFEQRFGLFVRSYGGAYKWDEPVERGRPWHQRLRWYAYSYTAWDMDGSWFYPIGFHWLVSVAQWSRLALYYGALKRIARSGRMEIEEGEVLQFRKIRLRVVREPY